MILKNVRTYYVAWQNPLNTLPGQVCSLYKQKAQPFTPYTDSQTHAELRLMEMMAFSGSYTLLLMLYKEWRDSTIRRYIPCPMSVRGALVHLGSRRSLLRMSLWYTLKTTQWDNPLLLPQRVATEQQWLLCSCNFTSWLQKENSVRSVMTVTEYWISTSRRLNSLLIRLSRI